MASLLSLEEGVSLIFFTVRLLLGSQPPSGNPFHSLDLIGKVHRRYRCKLAVQCGPSRLIKRIVSQKLSTVPFIDMNCVVLVHPRHLVKLKMANGQWVIVQFRPALCPVEQYHSSRWVRVYSDDSILEDACCVSTILYNNCTDRDFEKHEMHLVDPASRMLPGRDSFYVGLTIPRRNLRSSPAPCIASSVHLAVIEHPSYRIDGDFEEVLVDYFDNPRLLCSGDVLSIPVQQNKLKGAFPLNAESIAQSIYFSVVQLSCSNSCSSESCHLAQVKLTKLTLVSSCQSSRIPLCDSLVDADGTVNIPPHMAEVFHRITAIMRSQLREHSRSHLVMAASPSLSHKHHTKSIRHVASLHNSKPAHTSPAAGTGRHSTESSFGGSSEGPSLMSRLNCGHLLVQGCSTELRVLQRYLRGSLGCSVHTAQCWRLKADTSGATETKLMQALQRSKSSVPTVLVLEEVDVLVKTAPGAEDYRVCAALGRGLEQLAAANTVVIATCTSPASDSQGDGVPDSIWRLFSYQEQLPTSLSSDDRKKLAHWFLTNKYSQYLDESRGADVTPGGSRCTELVSLLTHKTADYTFSTLDTVLQEASRLCCQEWEQEETVSLPSDDRVRPTDALNTSTISRSDSSLQANKHNSTTVAAAKLTQHSSNVSNTNTSLVLPGHSSGSSRPRLLPHHVTAAVEAVNSVRRQSSVASASSVPHVLWRDVGGLEQAKRELVNAIHLPLRYPDLVAGGMRRAGVLLYGPPGTGKTLLAKAVASECGLSFMSVKGPELLNMYVGQSEHNVRQVFREARAAAPCVVFFDELDALTPSRGAAGDSGGVMDRVVSAVVAELDECSSSSGGSGPVFVLAATNRPDLLDPALLRPGRLEKLVYLGPCTDPGSLLQILRALTSKLPLGPDVSLERVVQQLPLKLTGADLAAVASEACYAALRRTVASVEDGSECAASARLLVTEEDLLSSAASVTPSVSDQQLAQYAAMAAKAASAGGHGAKAAATHALG